MTAADVRRLPIGSQVYVTEIRRDSRGRETMGVSHLYEVELLEGIRVLFRFPGRGAYRLIKDYKNCVYEEAQT